MNKIAQVEFSPQWTRLMQTRVGLKILAKSLFYYVIGKNKNSIIVRFIVKISSVIVNAHANKAFYDIKFNGEEFLLRNLSKLYNHGEIIAFDVGANTGEYTEAVRKYFPISTVHCFEIFRQNYDLLKNNQAISSENVVFNCFGLSDTAGKVEANYFPSNPRTGGINSLAWDKKLKIAKKTVRVEVKRGDEYAKKQNIGQINILKIDAEGHDFFVLKGFDDLLNDGLIDVVQFEHMQGAILSRIMLADFYEFLTPKGYLLGRLHPGGVALKPYDPFQDEDNSTGIYVAIQKDKTAIIARLNITPMAR